jgi:hypothetical protein
MVPQKQVLPETSPSNKMASSSAGAQRKLRWPAFSDLTESLVS